MDKKPREKTSRKRKSEVEAGVRGRKKKDSVAEQEAGSKPAGKKPAARKTAGKKSAGKKPEAAGKGGSSRKSKAVKGTKVPAPGQAGSKPGRRSTITLSEGSAASAAETVEVDPFEVAKQKVKGSVPAIVEAMVKKAKAGSCTHAKTLLEMTGAKHMFGGEAEVEESGEPWAKLVLDRMDEAEQKGMQKDLREAVAEP